MFALAQAGEAGRTALEKLLGDEVPAVRAQAARMMQFHLSRGKQVPDAFQRLLPLLKDASPAVRIRAAETVLWAGPHAGATAVLIDALSLPGRGPVVEAADALRFTAGHNAAAVPALRKLAAQGDYHVQNAAKGALAAIEAAAAGIKVE